MPAGERDTPVGLRLFMAVSAAPIALPSAIGPAHRTMAGTHPFTDREQTGWARDR